MSVTYAIGDIHGCEHALLTLLAKVFQDAARRQIWRPKIVTLGDYLHRGPNSRGVIKAIMAASSQAEIIALRGNHEEMFLAYLAGSGCSMARLWSINRCWESLFLEAGIPINFAAETASKRRRAELREYLGRDVLEFLQATRYYEFDDRMNLLFVHAGIMPGVPLQSQDPHTLVQIREEFFEHRGRFPFTVVHGHTVVDDGPTIAADRINIDTGAYRTGVLTAAVFDSEEPGYVRFIQSNGPMDGAVVSITSKAGTPRSRSYLHS